ncbi:MAG: alpha/beta fold hydrolase [Acetatifactor sp.]|nr:alpha/beta fold hydrolase [Acetatifactor sp.]
MVKDVAFKKKNGNVIRGRMYLPAEGGKRPVVIFSHGFGSNFRELMHHGEGFAEAGICCLFFDFCGGGMESASDGAMTDMTVRTECEDLETVIAGVKELENVDPDRIFLQGESMGGLVSALTAAKCPEDIAALVLWYPAFVIPEDSAKRYAAGVNECFGLALNEHFNEQAMGIDVYGEIGGYGGPVLIIHGDRDPVVPYACSERAVSVYPDGELIRMPGAGHGFDGKDSQAAREYSISFIRKHL